MTKIKKILIAGLTFAAFALFINIVNAQSELLFGQHHFYSVVFRGNGEAITHARVVVTNPNETPLKEFSFEIPNVEPSEIVIYQQKLSLECREFNYTNSQNNCLRYAEPDYTQSYYNVGREETVYRKVAFTKTGNKYTFAIPLQIEPFKSGAFIISYAAKGFVKESSGLYKFEYETLKVPSRIESLRVAVDVDSEYILKDRKSQVNYGTRTLEMDSVQSAPAISSQMLDRVVQKIGFNGELIKEAKNLAPLESFIVKGSYAKSWFRLNLFSIVITLLILIGIIVGAYYGSKYLKRKKQIGGGNERTHIHDTYRTEQKVQNRGTEEPFSLLFLKITNIATGLLSVVGVIILTYFLTIILQGSWFYRAVGDDVMKVVIFITIILLYVFIIFGPAVLVGIKHGGRALVSVLASELFWFLVTLLLYLFFFKPNIVEQITPPILYDVQEKRVESY